MSTLQPITSNEEYQAHVAALPPTTLSVLYFHAPWAAPCAQMTTILSTLASTYPASSPPAVSFASINAEELPDVSEAHDVTAVPFVVLRKGDSTLDTISGTDATRLRAAVEKHSGAAAANGARTTLPPAQAVTRPATQPEPAAAPPASAPAAAAAATNGTSTAKDLSGYAPSDPAPAAEKASPEDLNARLHDLTHAAPVMLFMKGTPSAPQCGFSRQLVGILREHSVRYGFFNILADDDVRQGLKAYSDWPTFPQLYLNGELVGGLDIVREEIDANPDFFDEYRVEAQKPAAALTAEGQTATA